METPIAWFENDISGRTGIFYVNPNELCGENYIETHGIVPLYDGWQEAYDEAMDGIDLSTQAVRCLPNGEFEVFDIPYEYQYHPQPEPTEDLSDFAPVNWKDLSEAIKTGINSI